jgi:hypothetical protein
MATIKNLLIVLLILVLGFFVLAPNNNGVSIPNTITKIDTFFKHDTLKKWKKGDSIPFVVLDTFYLIDSIKIHDTPEMIHDYLSVKSYTDTFRIDTSNYISVQDTISQNKIFGRGYKSHLTEKTIIITNDIIHKPKNELYIGLVGDSRRLDDKIGVGIGLTYKKQNEVYIINFTTNQISLGLYKKLF